MNNEAIDSEARRDIAKLWTAHEALSIVVMGPAPNRDNGIRSQVKDHEQQLDSIETWRAHYLDAERKRTCYGLEEIHRREQVAVEEIEEDTTVKVAEVQAAGTIAAAREQAHGQVAREWVVVAGTLLLLLKDLIVPFLKEAVGK
jgi:hypothetical protein